MTPQDYLKKSADIAKRLDIVRKQVDEHVQKCGNTDSPTVQPLINRQWVIIDELKALDDEFFRDI